MDMPARLPQNLDAKEIQEQVDSLSWYHTLELGQGVVTPGVYDHRPYVPFYGLPRRLDGVSVLDVGAASGFFSFEMEHRGANVTATELPGWMDHDFGPDYRPDGTLDQLQTYLHDPFLFAREILSSQAVRRDISVYDLDSDGFGLFDLVFCGSVLLHLTDPIKALWSIRSVTREAAIIATEIDPTLQGKPMATFAGQPDGIVWWIPNRAGLEAMVESAGFTGWEWYSDFRLDYANGQQGGYHGVLRAWTTPGGRPSILDDSDAASEELIAQYRPRSTSRLSGPWSKIRAAARLPK